MPTSKDNSKDRNPPESKDDARNLTSNKNSEDQMAPNKNQVVNLKAPREPYDEVCTFEEDESVTPFAKKNC